MNVGWGLFVRFRLGVRTVSRSSRYRSPARFLFAASVSASLVSIMFRTVGDRVAMTDSLLLWVSCCCHDSVGVVVPWQWAGVGGGDSST